MVSYPKVFHRLLEPLHVTEWQVSREVDQLRIPLAKPAEPSEEGRLAA